MIEAGVPVTKGGVGRSLGLRGFEASRAGGRTTAKDAKGAKRNKNRVLKRTGDFTREVIGAAIEVHRSLGPGLLESAYRACLVHEFSSSGLQVATEVPIPVEYRGTRLDCGYRIDLVIEGQLLVELKSVKAIEPIHAAQLLTYLKLARRPIRLLINFNVLILKRGIRRVIVSSFLP